MADALTFAEFERVDHESAHVSASVANVVMHELGDVLWYIMIMAQKVGCTLVDVARANIRARDERAARADAAKSGSLPARS